MVRLLPKITEGILPIDYTNFFFELLLFLVMISFLLLLFFIAYLSQLRLRKLKPIFSFIKSFTPVNIVRQNLRGFTLIELLVVIAIIAVLAIIGLVIFSAVQSRARDSKRLQDITAMSRAMEVNYVAGTGYTTPLNATWFADGLTPTNPSPGGATYYTNSPTTAGYTFCARLENSTGNSNTSTGISGVTNGNYFCKKNAQ